MKRDIQLLIDKINNRYKRMSIWKRVVSILSCIVVFLTIYFLMSSAVTLNKEKSYNFRLLDSYNYTWKEGKTREYNLDLYFMDTEGNYIEGHDITLEIGPNSFKDDPYGFGFIPISGETTRGLNLITSLDLEEIVLSTGEKYIFDYAEVYVNDTWQKFSETSNHWDIWCQSSSSSIPVTDYGWRGKYGDNIGYTINSNTEYRFVYKLVRYGQSETVESLGTDSGITFKMFNYTGDNSETGVNANGLWNYFTFHSDATIINNNTDADGYVANRAHVLSKLDNGYPVFDCRGYCVNKSLGYLFGADVNANGVEPVGVTMYNPTNTLLQKEIVDGVEYYYYDSNRNAVDYDTENNRFMVRNYVERGSSVTTYVNEATRYEFLPFNYWNSNRELLTTTTNLTYNYENAEVDHWFGMTMEFSFYMPENGTINGNDMIFSFSGDDDVWVFIDDVLVLDLGGTHGAVDGSINFKTGEVEGFLNWNGNVGTVEAGTKNITNIYDAFVKANATESTKWNQDNTTFDKYTRHTLKFFYLERGASVSNCKIRFNIPVLPSGSLSVQKEFNGIDNYNDSYEFTLYDVTNDSKVPVTDAKYVIGDKEYYTDESGKFTLKTDEVAIFKLTNYHKYYVEETNTGDHAVSYKCSLDGIECQNINKTDEFIINPDSAYQVVFTNTVKTFDLNISKIAYLSDDNETFEFQIILKDKDNLPVSINDDENNPSKYIVDNTNGIITFSLKSGKDITIKDIPINTIVTLKETKHDGYQTMIKTEDIVLSNSDTYEFIMDSDKTITVHNTPGVTLPETGGIGIWIYLLIGLSLIIITLKYKNIINVKEGGR